ncbi:Phospholipase A2 [Caenorhabditis elegans]|uniref:Phospholipase A2 n=1 Tax=Caenorhabditis elegans TaxID=6239 RepID=Q3V5J7_CAEEL|nr:Phospholipase A2 [Caenorhabditis elegans]CCD65525.1 Phospholipase A2 [Caenorhabditis elegans]|eukprot:NP_001033458.1 Phospholipase A(2) [Caenorhabditis elegans]
MLLVLLLALPAIVSSSCNILYQLDDMSYCRIGQPFDAYRYYGCSCSGISPNKPIDGIDRCCQVHNDCYNELLLTKKCQNSNSPYFCLYKWECVYQQPACNNESKCTQSVCQCDEQFINCLAKYPYPTFSKKCQYSERDPILKMIATASAATAAAKKN